MIAKLNIQNLYENLVEPILVIDRKTKLVVYCNEACKRFRLISENMSSSELMNTITTNMDYEAIQRELLSSSKECFVEDASIRAFAEGEVKGGLRIGFVDESAEHIYMIFQYEMEELKQTFVKNRCYETIYGASSSYPFRLDIEQRNIYFIGPILEQFNLPPVMYNYPQPVLESQVLHDEDVLSFQRMVEHMYKGEPASESFRSYTADGHELWYQPDYVVNRDASGKPVELIGLFVNIQEKKELEIKLHTDELTGCLNKVTFEQFVNQDLMQVSNGDKHALFIIDVDNFKAVNDNLGHQFGDVVLREAGENLRKLFRDEDYVGRIGGDEFMVFMKGVESQKVLEEHAEKIIKVFDNTYTGKARQYHTTASLGVVLYPDDGEDFETLYNRADIALYDTKHRGKNGYSYYNETMIEGNMCNTTPFDVASRALSQHFEKQIIVDIFGLLNGTKDYRVSLNKVLELLAVRFGVSRSYIFEVQMDDERYFDNTFEWCAEGIIPQIDNLQQLPKEVYDPLFRLTNEEGIFYCNNLNILQGEPTFDVMVEQGILSCLLACNREGDEINTVVGFDDCLATRVWSPIEIGTLLHASKIINQFLRYMKALKVTKQAMKEKMKVLDGLYSYAYVIEEETCELKYFNQEFKEVFLEAEVGDKCYQVLHGKEAQCGNCPIIKMKAQGKEKYRCIMPMGRLNQQMLVNTTDIGLFEESKCMFFSCTNMEELDE